MIASSLNTYTMVDDGTPVTGAPARAALAAGFQQSWSTLAAAGMPVAVIKDTPLPNIDVPACVAENTDSLTACAVPRSEAEANLGAAQLAAAAELPDVTMLDLNDRICPADQCAAVIGGVIVYRDVSHLTATYSRSLAPGLTEAMRAIPDVPFRAA